MTTIHISTATSGKLRPALVAIPVNDLVALIEFRTQVLYHEALGYAEIASKGGMWQGSNGNSVVTITCDKG